MSVGHINSIKRHTKVSQENQTPFEKKPLERKSVNDEINSLKGIKKLYLITFQTK